MNKASRLFSNKLDEPESAGKIFSIPRNKVIGAANTKNKLSKIAVSKTKPRALPGLMPSFQSINTATAVPPTTEGVTAEANSHKIMT